MIWMTMKLSVKKPAYCGLFCIGARSILDIALIAVFAMPVIK